MKVDWKLLGTPEHKEKTKRDMALRAAEMIMNEVPNSINPYYNYGCVLENLMVIEELGITETKVAEFKYHTFSTPVTTCDLLYVTNKVKEAKALLNM